VTATGGDARSTRDAYRDTLAALMAADRRVVCLDSDTGLFDAADLRDSGRYVNLGIAEHTLMAVAAGLAACGKLPFVNTMATFASTRALEAVKIDIACNALPVRIAATHGGLAAGHLGPTHHALEDLAIMRVLPSMTVVVPADAAAVEAAVRQTMALPGPVYLRLGRDPTPPLCGAAAPPVIGRAQRLRPGDDLTIVACGPYPVLAALRASEVLASAGVGAAVLNMHTLKPLDVAALLAAASHSAALITVEEHWRLGGLGAAVAEALAELAPIRIARIGMSNVFVDAPGGQRDLLERYGIDHRAVVTRALALLSQSRETSGRRATPVDTPPAATSMEVPG
jgi:transketolase